MGDVCYLGRPGSPVVPFYPFSFWVPLLKPNSRKKGTLIIKGLLGNLVEESGNMLLLFGQIPEEMPTSFLRLPSYNNEIRLMDKILHYPL